jgi:teichuronic acid biosynthesis glycosyltransferase TuaC
MKVLFVRSGNYGPDPITQNQGDSLIGLGIELHYFDIIGKGITGYISNFYKLHKTLRRIKPEIIHSHYSLSGFFVVISMTRIPVITSLMGSDVNQSGLFKIFITRLFIKYCWKETIVKSAEMKARLALKSVFVIPNGIDLKRFKCIHREEALSKLQWEKDGIHILFGSDPDRPEKNFKLASDAIKILSIEFPNIILHVLCNIPREEVYLHYNAASFLLLTSLSEGSPNVIKEAMACECPIVTTPVGDVRDVINNTPGCYITSFDLQDVAGKMKSAILFNGRTNGRSLMKQYDSDIIAERIVRIYMSLTTEKQII